MTIHIGAIALLALVEIQNSCAPAFLAWFTSIFERRLTQHMEASGIEAAMRK
tara:strand:+ start:355 stop:510 length:156 start_codon:yes stop_codon:yes gene_type:complete